MTLRLSGQERVHFVGIAGIGMSALARYLLAHGHEVSGSDRDPGQQGDMLRRLGARVFRGHDAAHVDGAAIVVQSSAVPATNPELEEAKRRGLTTIKRAELLASIMNAGRGIAVAGTHGKTTTTALIGWVLSQVGRDPTVLVGGIVKTWDSNARIGAGDLVVVEADEYDASFLQLRPDLAVLTNVEPDHLDYYQTAENLHAAFGRFLDGVAVQTFVCVESEVATRLAREHGPGVVTYGMNAGQWQAGSIEVQDTMTRFSLRSPDRQPQPVAVPLMGEHNVQNALAALAVCDALLIPLDASIDALRSFPGVERRFDVKGEVAGVLVVDDYAHHPTEIQTTLRAIRDRYGRPLRVIFQPHTYSRTRALLQEFAAAFASADAVYLLDIYAAREADTLGISGSHLARLVQAQHPSARYVATADAAIEAVARDVRPGDIVVTMGAGDVTALGPRLLRRLEAA